MINENIPFMLYASCIPVKGAKRSIICDLEKEEYSTIPNTVYELLKKYEGKTISLIKSDYPENKEVIDSYFNFLNQEEYIFFTETPELFPKLNMTWQEPTKITNAIIDFDSDSRFKIENVIDQLINIRCSHIQIRVFCEKDFDFYKQIISKYNTARIYSFELIIKYHTSITVNNLTELIQNNDTCLSFVVHSSPNVEISKNNVIFTKKIINSEEHCGIISSNFFAINIKAFTEAYTYNSCLNGKISVNSKGEIKNCPSLKTVYGHIHNTNLDEVIDQKVFNEKFRINKDQIEICKDCEFRYICSDCRAYTQGENNLYSKPLKCNYDPYNAVWT